MTVETRSRRRLQHAVALKVHERLKETPGYTWELCLADNVSGWTVEYTNKGTGEVVREAGVVLPERELRGTWNLVESWEKFREAAADGAALAAEREEARERREATMQQETPGAVPAEPPPPTSYDRARDLRVATSASPDTLLARPVSDETLIETMQRYRHGVTWVRAGDINTRPGYQRLLSERWAAEIARDFNGFLMRPVLCARRADGTLWCIDGQHRLRAFTFYLGREDEQIEVDIYENLTYGEETLLCESFVHSKPSGVLDYLRLKYEREDPDALALVQAVRAAGLDVAFDKAGKGRVASAGALVAVYEAGGGEHLSETLNLLTDCFGEQSRVYIQPQIMGVHGFLVRYGEHPAYSRKALVEKCQNLGLGAVQQKQAILLPTISGGNRATAFGKALQTIYNAGRRANFLPEWVEGVLTQRQRERREAINKLVGREFGFTPAGRANGRKKHLTIAEEDHA